MKPELQRIAIAEACGWTFQVGTRPTYGGTNRPRGWKNPVTGNVVMCHPDYLGSLDAMHEAEKTLKGQQLPNYHDELVSLFSRSEEAEAGFYETHATASQRAEAFLRTIGKWVE
jgi:hypothetical protein